jgi:hypothetical protein
MELILGESVSLMNGETVITGRLLGVKMLRDEQVEAVWIEHIVPALYMADGWLVVDDTEDEDIRDLFDEEEIEDE